MKKIEREVKVAYADCWMDNERESQEIRDLNFRASKFVSKEDAIDIFSKYVEGYNEFSPELLIHLPNDSKVCIAREGSVCIYVKSKELNSYNKRPFFKALKADEFDYDEDNDEYRIWWD